MKSFWLVHIHHRKNYTVYAVWCISSAFLCNMMISSSCPRYRPQKDWLVNWSIVTTNVFLTELNGITDRGYPAALSRLVRKQCICYPKTFNLGCFDVDFLWLQLRRSETWLQIRRRVRQLVESNRLTEPGSGYRIRNMSFVQLLGMHSMKRDNQ